MVNLTKYNYNNIAYSGVSTREVIFTSQHSRPSKTKHIPGLGHKDYLPDVIQKSLAKPNT